jgi:hypothetical protein
VTQTSSTERGLGGPFSMDQLDNTAISKTSILAMFAISNRQKMKRKAKARGKEKEKKRKRKGLGDDIVSQSKEEGSTGHVKWRGYSKLQIVPVISGIRS